MKPVHIVLIEDNPGDVLLVELALKENGVIHELINFRSGEDGVMALCTSAQEGDAVPDVILLDLNTPKSDGFAVLGKLKQCPRLANVPIAVITSSPASSDKHRTHLHGSRYIQKPSQLAEFLNTVGQAVKEMLAESAASSASANS